MDHSAREGKIERIFKSRRKKDARMASTSNRKGAKQIKTRNYLKDTGAKKSVKLKNTRA